MAASTMQRSQGICRSPENSEGHPSHARAIGQPNEVLGSIQTTAKARMVQKMLGGRNANSLPQQVGLHQPTPSKGHCDGRFLRRRGLPEELLRPGEATASLRG